MQIRKLANPIIKHIITMTILVLPLSLWADTGSSLTVTTPSITKDQYSLNQLTRSQFEKLDSTQQQSIAGQWDLSIDDYDRYLTLMETTVNGVYYTDKHLDPSWILGFNAPDETTRQKYAIIAIKNERARVAKELAFERDFQQLQIKLYPGELPITLLKAATSSHVNVANTLQPGDTLLLFTDLLNTQTTSLLNHAIHLMQSRPDTHLNIYFVGEKITDSAIRTWASQHNISLDLVQKHIITLNHDNGNFARLTKGESHSLPLLVLDQAGIYHPVSI